MPVALAQRLRDEGLVPPDYEGHGLLNVAATVLDVLGLRDGSDPPPLADLDPALREGARDVVLILADGLGWEQLHGLRSRGELPFIGSLMARAERGEAAQLMRATTIFPSTTTAAITTLNTARTPQEHGNIAYFTWLDEFGVVAQLLRWGPAVQRRGSF
ncbi:MAG: alkaline phosphatase family protein, partial [Candidatus Limnocylindria bacterium]